VVEREGQHCQYPSRSLGAVLSYFRPHKLSLRPMGINQLNRHNTARLMGTNKFARAVTFVTCVPDVPGSYIDRDADCSD
jgi:hypothetical protein